MGADYCVLRLGGGVLPDVVAYGHVDEVVSWGSEPAQVRITAARALPMSGNLGDLRREVLGISRAVSRWVHYQDGQLGAVRSRRASYAEPPQEVDLAVDLTGDPSASDLLPWSSQVVVRTGRGRSMGGGAENIGRLDLLSHLKSRMARNQVKVEIEDAVERSALRKAMVETTQKPPAQEVDGLALVDTSERESTALAVALLTWRAYHAAPITQMSERGRRKAVEGLVVL